MGNHSEGRGASAPLLDLVYVVRPGDDNDELRYSLRSVAQNLPHRKVFVFGSCPSWVSDEVVKVPLTPLDDKFSNIRQSTAAAVNDPRVSNEFVYMNDDMFVIEPIESIPVYHRGPFAEFWDYLTGKGKNPDGEWMQAIWHTAQWVGKGALAYECHTPLVFSKHLLRQVLADYPANLPFTAHGTYQITGAGPLGRKSHDVKAIAKGRLEDSLGTPFLSSVDHSFARYEIGDYIRSLFPHPCRYEAP